MLEAVHYLGRGLSFRSATPTRLIRHGTDKFSIFAQIISDAERTIPVGVERDIQGNARLRVAEKETSSVTELASFLPIRVINSQSHHLLEAGPAFRRKYLDWGLFYQSQTFLTCWRQFERVLKQRNAILRDRRPKRELDPWTEELVKHGLALDQLRLAYVQSLTPVVEEMAQTLLGISNLKIHYQCGWDKNSEYAAVLASHHAEECRLGHTVFGPHRADLDIKMDALSVKHFLSRGQQKLLICAMILAQGILLTKQADTGLIYLVDDLPSELDLQSRQKLISLLSKQQTQIFITAIESEAICDLMEKPKVPVKVFHVEHGSVVELADASSNHS